MKPLTSRHRAREEARNRAFEAYQRAVTEECNTPDGLIDVLCHFGTGQVSRERIIPWAKMLQDLRLKSDFTTEDVLRFIRETNSVMAGYAEHLDSIYEEDQ